MIRINDKLPQFADQNVDAMDRALWQIAKDINMLSKELVPWKEGHLSASGRAVKIGRLKYQTQYNMEYAAFQEFGGDGNRVVKNYSRPGRQAHYLRDAGQQVSAYAIDYFKREANNIRV